MSPKTRAEVVAKAGDPAMALSEPEGRPTGRPVEDFSPQELVEFAGEHVVYEIRMFSRALGAATGRSGEIWPMNVCVEELALHLRNLLDFFYPQARRRSTDVVAVDFFASPSSWVPPAKTSLLRVSHLRAHREVAHLTTDRKAEQSEKIWDVEAISADLLALIEAFLAGAELVDRSFRHETGRICQDIRTWSGIS